MKRRRWGLGAVVLVLVLRPVGVSAAAQPVPAAWVEQALAARAERQWDLALDLLQRALAVQPKRETKILLAETLAWSGQFAEAEELWRALAEEQSTREVQLGLARSILWQQRYAEARLLLQEVLREAPEDVEAVEELARAHYWSGDLRAAARLFRELLRLDPGRDSARKSLSEITANSRTWRVETAWRDDSQPLTRPFLGVAASFPSDPLTHWTVEAGRYELDLDQGLTRAAEFAGAGVKASWPSAGWSASGTVRWFEFGDGEDQFLGMAELRRTVAPGVDVAISAGREELLWTRSAAADHPWAEFWGLRAEWTHDRRLAAASARSLHYFDGNRGASIDGWVLQQVGNFGPVRLDLGLSAAWRDTKTSRFVPRLLESVPVPGGFRYRFTGEYVTYFTPLDQREIRGVARASGQWGKGRWSLRASGGSAWDQGEAFGPDSGPAVIPVIEVFQFGRTFNPWEVDAAFSYQVGKGLEFHAGWSRSSTIFYEADTFHAALAGRF